MGSDRHSPSLMSSQLLSSFPFTVPISDLCTTLISQVDSSLLVNKAGSHQCQHKGGESDMKAPQGVRTPRGPSCPGLFRSLDQNLVLGVTLTTQGILSRRTDCCHLDDFPDTPTPTPYNTFLLTLHKTH